MKKYFIFFIIIIVMLSSCSKENKPDENEIFEIAPEYKSYIFSLLNSDNSGNHNHEINYVSKTGGQFHSRICKLCGEDLGDETHYKIKVKNSIAYRGNKRYHTKILYCVCGLMYAEEFSICTSEYSDCSCLKGIK